MNTKQIMIEAWKTARAAAANFGGRAVEYISESLRMAWATAKMSVEALVNLGGKLWEKADMRRVYFNDLEELFCAATGLRVGRYNTGNISSASINGQSISNCEARRMLRDICGTSKLWFDAADGKFHSRDMGRDALVVIANYLRASV
ncbi:hypothetical protein [Chromobacterium phragmitis]|uniref:hypothetical protein n=1 Tax=Chromobacterium phragmitis TaxID=2202141 RepID=UPI003877A0A1